MKTIELTDEQFDKLEEAADILSMSFNFCESMGDAVGEVSDFLIRSLGPLYEMELLLQEDSDGISV